MRLRTLRLAFAAALMAWPAAAQAVQGRVVETSGAPAGQVLVVLVDASGRQAAHGMSDQDGGFALRAPAAGRYTLRAERVGFAATVSPAFELAARQTVQQRLVLDSGPVGRQQRVISGAARRCELRPGGDVETTTVWEEARKAFDSTAYGQQHLFSYRVERYDRDLDPRSGRVIRESRRDTGAVAQHPFATPRAAELSAKGWVQNTPSGIMYYAPDASVLVSDEFLADHCLRIAEASAAGDSLVGVAFEPVGGRRLPDISGVLWLDRRTAGLRRVEYTYTGLPTSVSHPRLGGTVEYAHLASGPWIVRRWSIRMPQVEVRQGTRTAPGREGDLSAAYENSRLFAIREDGGEVISTTAQNGTQLLGSAGVASIEGVVWDSTRAAPLAGARVYVSGTGFETVSDSAGRFRIGGLRGGTYTVAFTHYQLGPVAAAVRPATVVAEPGKIATIALAVPGLATVAAAVCPAGPEEGGRGVIVGSVRGAQGSAAGATVRATWSAAGAGRPAGYVATSADDAGGFALCGVPEGQSIDLTAGALTGTSARAEVRLAAGTPLRRDLLLVPASGAVAGGSPGAAIPIRGITATGRPTLADFQRRRSHGRGLFLTHEQIEAKNPHRAIDLFRGMPGVRLHPEGRGGVKIQMAGATAPRVVREAMPQHPDPENRSDRGGRPGARRAATASAANDGFNPHGLGQQLENATTSQRAGDCQVQFYVDGALFYPTAGGDISSDIPVSRIQAVEVYRNLAETPVEFRGNPSASCGTVVIWTAAAAAR